MVSPYFTLGVTNQIFKVKKRRIPSSRKAGLADSLKMIYIEWIHLLDFPPFLQGRQF